MDARRFSPVLLLIFTLVLLLNVKPCFGQESEDTSTQTISQLQDAGAGLVAKLRAAMNGDSIAGNELLNEYFVPAAMALILLIVGYMFASFLGGLIGSMVSSKIDKTVGRFAGRMTKNVIMVLVLLGALGYFGVDVTSFAAILAAAGFAVGMALQGTLSNFAAGIMLLVFRPFKVDDYIKVSDTEGTVEEIDLFTTKLNTPDHRHIIVPNSNIFGETMINYTHNSSRRVDVSVGVSYDADTKQTRRILSTALANIPSTLQSPPPQVYLMELGDSAVVWQCRIWCAPDQYWAVREHAMEMIKSTLDSAGIGIPYPQMDIHVAGKVLAKAA